MSKICLDCGRRFSEFSISDHKALQHEKCSICLQVVYGRQIKSHPCFQQRPQICNLCKQAFSSKKCLMKHQRLPHKACGCGLAVVPSRLDFHQRNCSSAGSSQDLGYDMSPEAFLPTARDFIQTHADQRHTFQLSICQILSSCMELYRQQATAAVAKCEAMLATLIESAKMGSRLDNPAREYLRVIKDHTVGTPITSSQYHKGLWSVPSDNFVICSSDDAEKILMQGAPLLPILILPSLNKAANNHLAIEPYLKLLQTRPTLDIHDYDVEIYDGRFEAVALNSMSAVTRFLDATKGPVNFLNLSGHKQNAMPSCLERLDEYHIMETIRSQNGKRGEKIVCDLTESTRFQLLASKGAFHLPHVDRHGVITTVFNDEGEKLWLVWPFENTTDWSRSHSCLSGRVLALYLEEGSTLIQPSGMIHAPFTLENTLMTGTMHWHPQTMLQVLEQTQAEIQAPYITNEPVSEEFLIKVELILQRWNEEAGLVRWGTKEDLEKCRKLMEWFRDHCRCRRGCGPACRCKKRGRECDARCHGSNECRLKRRKRR